jgi:hypothetical protein
MRWVNKNRYEIGEMVLCILDEDERVGVILNKFESYCGYVTYIVLCEGEECWFGMDNLMGMSVFS